MSFNFKISTTSNLESIFSEIISSYGSEEDKIKIPSISYKSIFVGTLNGISRYRTIVNVRFIKHTEIKGLRILTGNEASSATLVDILGTYENKTDYLDNIQGQGLLQRKYSYGVTGDNLNVLSVDLNIDNTWYFNTIYNSLQQAIQNNSSKLSVEDNDTKTSTDSVETAKEIQESSISNDLRAKNINDISDLYTYYKTNKDSGFEDKVKSYSTRSFIGNETVNNSGDNEDTKLNEDAKNNLLTDISYKNWKDVGFMNTLKMDIVGDPLWLRYYSDENNSGDNHLDTFPHIIFKHQGFYNFNGDTDEYIKDNISYLTTVYLITTVKSSFENGSFKQKIEGYVPAPFLTTTSEEEGNKALQNINKNKEKEQTQVQEKKEEQEEINIVEPEKTQEEIFNEAMTQAATNDKERNLNMENGESSTIVKFGEAVDDGLEAVKSTWNGTMSRSNMNTPITGSIAETRKNVEDRQKTSSVVISFFADTVEGAFQLDSYKRLFK